MQSQDRRNAENLSESVGVPARAMQRFLTAAPWDDDAVMGRLQEYLAPRLGHSEAVWVLDGSDFPKQGRKSAGVARQYCGRLGKVANCQAGMFLAYVSPLGRALVDQGLYLPESWTSDDARCAAAGVPEDKRRYRSKTELALELLQRALVRGHLKAGWVAGDDAFGNWRSGLAESAVELIECAAKHHDHPGGATANLVRTVIIERGIQETPAGVLEGQFSDLINAIPSSDGQSRVLERLTELFPDEAHFWAHLGRFYTRILRDHSAAYDSHNKSLQIAPQDPVLYHMAGMALRGELDELLDKLEPSVFDSEAEQRVQSLAEESLRRFAASRDLEPRSEHSYISAIELIARTVRVAARLKGYGEDTAGFLVVPTEGWYRELVDTAETLIAEQVLARSGDEPSRFLQRAQANLDRAYGDLSRAIEGWTNLLDPRRGAYRPPIRRNIINAYLTRKNRDWSRITGRELERISILAQENLEEEPDSDQNLRMWLRVVRVTGELPLNVIAERLTYKSLREPTIDTLYYLYVLKHLQSYAGVRPGC